MIVLIVSLCFFHTVLACNDLLSSMQSLQKYHQRELYKSTLVKKILPAYPLGKKHSNIITENEWQELAIDDCICKLNRTQTAFGLWGMQICLQPISNSSRIKQRQKGLAKIKADERLYNKLCEILHKIKELEDSFLSYYEEHDQLSFAARQLYYRHFESILNKSKYALDYAYVADSCNAVLHIAQLICLNGLVSECAQAVLQSRPIDILSGLKKGFKNIFRDHDLNDIAFQKQVGQGAFDVPYVVYEFPQASTGWFVGLRNTFNQIGSHVHAHIAYAKDMINTTPLINTLLQGSFGDRWSLLKEKFNWASPIAFVWVLGQVAYNDYRLWVTVKDSYNRLVFLYKTQIALQRRLCSIAKFLKLLDELTILVAPIEGIAENNRVQSAYRLLNSPNGKMAQLKTLLYNPQFTHEKSLFFSRGHVLITHAFLFETKDELTSLMEAIGVIDAFISVVRILKEFDDEKLSFCFVDIQDSNEPFIEIHDGWLPLLSREQVINSLSLSKKTAANLILTGPNGGGKSTILKMVGQTMILGQSWGIAPASSCSLSLFAHCYTSFNAGEDIAHGVSTFMAQKKRLDYIKNVVLRNQADGVSLVLVDEPYRGTIEAEAEKRAYAFGNSLGQCEHSMLLMATHLKEPIFLENTGLFRNQHLEMVESDEGVFNRLFRLSDGPAWWWFNDLELRMRYIDALLVD